MLQASSTQVRSRLTHFQSPTLLTIAIIVVFGRACWAASLSNPSRLEPLRGFVRWNTFVVTSTSLLAFTLLCVGCIVVVSRAPNGVVNETNLSIVNAGNGILKFALVLQLLILAAFTLMAWRFRAVSKEWDVQWDEKRRSTWTWTKVMILVLVSLVLLFVRQLYHLIRFLLDWTGLPWLGLLFDAGPILTIIVLFAVYHPAKCLPRELTRLRLDKERLRSRTQTPKLLVSAAGSLPLLSSGSVTYA